MSLEDPFFVVKDEVFKALNKTRGLYLRWNELKLISSNSVDLEWTTTELRNALRSIEWDLEDLDDTIYIVEKNLTKFKIDNRELSSRKSFIECTRQEVKDMKEKMNMNRNGDADNTAREPLIPQENQTTMTAKWNSEHKYSKLQNQVDSPRHYDDFVNDINSVQLRMLDGQEEQLHVINNSVNSLKEVSRHIGFELDEQAIMLDEFNSELENAESKMDTTMKKIVKVLHINNDQRQWVAIVILTLILFILIILFVIL